MSSLLPLLYVGARNNATTPEMDESLSSSVIQAICMLSPRVPEDTRQQAQASLDEFKSNNPDAWRVCLSIFLKSVGNTGYFQRFFVALNIQEEDSFVLINVLSLLESFVRFRYQTLLEEDQLSLKTVLYTWIAQQYAFVEDKFPAFLRNKIAWILVLIFRSDFPNPWRSFFADFFILSPISASCMSIGGMAPSVMAPALPVLEGIAPIVVIEGTPPIASTLGSSPAAQLAHVDLLTRILLAIDQEVVDRDVQRADSELAQNALIKDAMREDCIPAIVELFYRIFVEEFFQQHTSIIASCLQVMSSYIPWIEISLVVSPRFLEVFFRFLLVPQLRDNACLCLNRVILKGMDAPAKIALIESISIISVVHSVSSQIAEAISSGATSEEQEEDFMASLASLVNTIGIQLMTNISKLQSGVVVTAAAPLGEEDPALASQACQMGLLLLQQCLPLMFAFLGHEDDDISLAVTPFATEFIRMNLADSTKQLGDLLSIVIHKMRYDADFDFEDAEEDQAALFEIRKAMKILFDHIRALNPEMVLSYVHDFVLHNINNWSNLNFVDVEIALKLMFYVGESQASSLFQELSLDGQTSGTGRIRSSNSGSADGSGTTTPGGSSSSGGLGIPTTPLSASNSGDPSLLSTSPSASQMNSALVLKLNPLFHQLLHPQ